MLFFFFEDSRSPEDRRPPRSSISLRPSPPKMGVGRVEVGVGSHLVSDENSYAVLFFVEFNQKTCVVAQGGNTDKGSGIKQLPCTEKVKYGSCVVRGGQYRGFERIYLDHDDRGWEELLAEPGYLRVSPLVHWQWF